MKVKYFFIVQILVIAGCLGPPADHVTPVNPDETGKADPVLVEEFKLAFGEFGKEDARKFGGLYLAYTELILNETKGNSTGDALKWLQNARELLKLQSYPSFKSAVVRETKALNQNDQLDADQRKKISETFKRIGLAAMEAGK